MHKVEIRLPSSTTHEGETRIDGRPFSLRRLGLNLAPHDFVKLDLELWADDTTVELNGGMVTVRCVTPTRTVTIGPVPFELMQVDEHSNGP